VTRGRSFWQFPSFLPVGVSLAAISFLFKMLVNPQLGQISQILKSWNPAKIVPHQPRDCALLGDRGGHLKGAWLLRSGPECGMLNFPVEMYDAPKVDLLNAVG